MVVVKQQETNRKQSEERRSIRILIIPVPNLNMSLPVPNPHHKHLTRIHILRIPPIKRNKKLPSIVMRGRDGRGPPIVVVGVGTYRYPALLPAAPQALLDSGGGLPVSPHRTSPVSAAELR